MVVVVVVVMRMRRSHQFQLLSKVGAAPTEKEIKLVDMGAADVKEY